MNIYRETQLYTGLLLTGLCENIYLWSRLTPHQWDFSASIQRPRRIRNWTISSTFEKTLHKTILHGARSMRAFPLAHHPITWGHVIQKCVSFNQESGIYFERVNIQLNNLFSSPLGALPLIKNSNNNNNIKMFELLVNICRSCHVCLWAKSRIYYTLQDGFKSGESVSLWCPRWSYVFALYLWVHHIFFAHFRLTP